MKIGSYISELLFEHGQVVLPGFGEFSTKYIPARFIREEKKIEPPKKVADFNAGKTEGGALLMEYASRKEQKPQEIIQKAISDFVAEIKQTLASGQKVQLDKLGIFSTDPDGNILFEPNHEINYLADTSGMAAVSEPSHATSKPVQAGAEQDVGIRPQPQKETAQDAPTRTHQAEPRTKPPKTPIIIRRNELAEEIQAPVQGLTKQDLPGPIKWLAWLIVPLGILIIIFALNWRHILGIKPQGADLAAPAETVIPAPNAELQPTEPPAQTVPAEAAPLVPEPGRMAYYIVVGAFMDEGLANTMVSNLRAQGASQASIFMVTDQGYHRVAYGFYYSLAEAEAQLPNVQQNIQPGAWIMPRRN